MLLGKLGFSLLALGVVLWGQGFGVKDALSGPHRDAQAASHSLSLSAALLSPETLADLSYKPLAEAPGFTFELKGSLEASEPMLFRVITETDYPHYVSYHEAEGFCQSLAGQWRLPEEGELYGLRDALDYTGLMVADEGEQVLLSRGKYWSATPAAGQAHKTVSMYDHQTYYTATYDEHHGVICVAGGY